MSSDEVVGATDKPASKGSGGGVWRFGVWHVARDRTWWAADGGGTRATWREAFDAAFEAIRKHPNEDAKASVRKEGRRG